MFKTTKLFGFYFIILFAVSLFFIACDSPAQKHHDDPNGNERPDDGKKEEEYPDYHLERKDEILFVNSDDWYDEKWYKLQLNTVNDYVISIDDKTNSTYTGNISFIVTSDDEQTTYFDSTKTDKKECKLTSFEGTVLIHVFPKEIDASCVGTYRISLDCKGEQDVFLFLVKHSRYFDIKLKPEVNLSVGNIIYEPFYGEKYDGSTTNLNIRYSYTISENSKDMAIKLDYYGTPEIALIHGGDFEVLFEYDDRNDDSLNMDSTFYTFQKSFKIKPKSQNDNPLSIELDDNTSVPVDSAKTVPVKYNDQYQSPKRMNTNVFYLDTESNIYKHDRNQEYAEINTASDVVKLECKKPGKICFIAQCENIYLACAVVDIIEEGGCYIVADKSEFVPLQTATFSLIQGGVDVSPAALWDIRAYSWVADFDKSTRTAYYNSGDSYFEISAYYQGLTYYFRGTTEDPQVYNLSLESELPYDKLLIGNTRDSYEINISGEYNSDKISDIKKCLLELEKPVDIDMSAVTGLTKLSGNNGGGLFHNCSQINELILPSTITEYGDYAFYRCVWLKEITPPAEVTKIGNYVFAECTSLTSAVINDTVTEIGNGTFDKCTNLTSAKIYINGLDTIKEFTFSRCRNLAELVIPQTITRVGQYAFEGCQKLTNPAFIKKLEFIAGGAFLGCSGFRTVEFSSKLREIQSYTFDQCTGLYGNITIPANVNEIGFRAFRGCTGIKRLILEDNENWQSWYTSSSDTSLPYSDIKMEVVIQKSKWNNEEYIDDASYHPEMRWYNYINTGEQCDYYHLWPKGTPLSYYVSNDNSKYIYGTFHAKAGVTYIIFFIDSDMDPDHPDHRYCDMGIDVGKNYNTDFITRLGGVGDGYVSPVCITMDEDTDLIIRVTIWKTYSFPDYGDSYRLSVIDGKEVVYTMGTEEE